MKGITLDDKEIAALYLKLANSPKNSSGRLITQSKSGVKYIFNFVKTGNVPRFYI